DAVAQVNIPVVGEIAVHPERALLKLRLADGQRAGHGQVAAGREVAAVAHLQRPAGVDRGDAVDRRERGPGAVEQHRRCPDGVERFAYDVEGAVAGHLPVARRQRRTTDPDV